MLRTKAQAHPEDPDPQNPEETKITLKLLEKDFCLDFDCGLASFEKGPKGPRFIIEGFASTNLQDLVDDVIQLDALRAAATDLLKNNTVFLNHDRQQPIGSVLDAKFIEGKGLWIKVLISETRKDIQQLVKENILNKFSIGGIVLSQRPGRHPKTGKQVNFIIRIKLHEVSLVSLPANQDARSLSWSLEKSSGGIKSHMNGGDINLKMKFKSDAEGRPIIRENEYVPYDGEGNFVELEIGKTEPAPQPEPGTEPEPEIQTGLDFSEEDLKAIEDEEKGRAQTAVKVKQVEHLCDLLLSHPDKDVVGVGQKIKELAEGIDFGQGPKSGADAGKGADIEAMVRKAFADAFTDLGLKPGAPRKPGPRGTQKGAPVAPVAPAGVPSDDDDPEVVMKAALEAIKAKYPPGIERLKAMAKIRSLGTLLPADPRGY